MLGSIDSNQAQVWHDLNAVCKKTGIISEIHQVFKKQVKTDPVHYNILKKP
jgi:hypothetical protein